MRHVKFEDAYCSYLQRSMTVNEVSGLYLAQREVYIKLYQDSFLCPECHLAKLIYVKAASPHFRTSPKASHVKGCSMVQPTLTPLQAAAYAENPQNKQAIIRQLDRAINVLIKGKKLWGRKAGDGLSGDEPVSPLTPKDRQDASRQLTRKRIDLQLDASDYGVDKIFYGNVALTWEQARVGNKKQIALRSLRKRRFLCRIYITDKVYSYIAAEYKQETPYPCKIAFLGNMRMDGNENNYTTLIRSDYLLIQRE